MLKKLFGSRISIFEVVGALLAALIGYYDNPFYGLIILICIGVIQITVCKTYKIQ